MTSTTSTTSTTTQRQRFIERASLLIRDSGRGDLSDFRIAEAMNGVAELGGGYKRYSDSVDLGSRAERLLINDIRRNVAERTRTR